MESKARFSSRVENYIRYRPGYPPQVIALLQEKCGLTAQSRVVDVGSGTGSLARLFLTLGCPLTGVEPNP
jgi:precorrin-6B methylase 2